MPLVYLCAEETGNRDGIKRRQSGGKGNRVVFGKRTFQQYGCEAGDISAKLCGKNYYIIWRQ